MTPNLQRIDYMALNGRQQENYNFQKLSAVLADFGFVTMRLSDDWGGADFIAQHIDGETLLRVQLKSRLTFDAKYQGKGLYISFPHNDHWYLYPHDEFLETVLTDTGTMTGTQSWEERGLYTFPRLSAHMLDLLSQYRLTGDTVGVA